MATFDLALFVADPTVDQLDKLKKRDLRDVAEHYGISFASSLRKAELKGVILKALVDAGVLSLTLPEVGQPVDSQAGVKTTASPGVKASRVDKGPLLCHRLSHFLWNLPLNPDLMPV